ncbi:hypothetical protein REPUB_Repub01dG0158000 [Reevesia pubescens]
MAKNTIFLQSLIGCSRCSRRTTDKMQHNKGQFTSSKKPDGTYSWGSQDDDNLPDTSFVKLARLYYAGSHDYMIGSLLSQLLSLLPVCYGFLRRTEPVLPSLISFELINFYEHLKYCPPS